MGLLWTMLVLALLGMPDTTRQDTDVIIALRVIPHASLPSRELDRARETATALLATGGVQIRWRDCSITACEPASGEPTVTVLLLPVEKTGGTDVCGEATKDGLTATPTVIVYVRSLADRVRAVHRGEGRSNPSLSAMSLGDLAGITIAHEVGHALGLGHARSGVMKARLTTGDLLDWRTGLTFDSRQRALMQSAFTSRQ